MAEAQQRQVEQAAANLVRNGLGDVARIERLVREPGRVPNDVGKSMTSSMVSGLLHGAEAAAPRGAEEIVRAFGRVAKTAFQAIAEGNLFRAAAAAAPELPREKSAEAERER